jgi:hypothetical protein
LNKIDNELHEIIERGKDTLFCPIELKSLEAAGNAGKASVSDLDIEEAKSLLSFSAYLLENSVKKDVYDSSEVKYII